MKSRIPPKNLPESYYPIWKALFRAEQKAGSRQAMAKSARISTGTIQRILTRGEVPDFTTNRSVRTRHAWVKTLVRIGYATGNDPREWISGIHIPWTGRVQDIFDGALKEIKSERAYPQPGPNDGRPSPPESGPLRIAIADLPPLSTRLPDYPGSFLEELANLLFCSLFPGRPLRFQYADTGEIYRELAKPKPQYHIGMGLQWTEVAAAHHHLRVPIYGLQMPMGKMILSSAHSQPKDPEYWENLETSDHDSTYFMVCRETFAYYYLTVLSRIPPEKLMIRDDDDLSVLAEDFIDETCNRSDCDIVLVHDEIICRRLKKILALNKKVTQAYNVEMMPTGKKYFGGVSIGIGFNSGAKHWFNQTERAMESEVSGPSKPFFKKLFTSLRNLSDDASLLVHDRAGDQVTAGLQVIDQVFVITQDTRFCRSCMMPLNKVRQKGDSDTVCRLCHDDGELLPRLDVQIMIGERLKDMHGNISKRDAIKKAGLFMKLMPAWQE